MVATVRCEEIANEKYASFTTNEVHKIVEDYLNYTLFYFVYYFKDHRFFFLVI